MCAPREVPWGGVFDVPIGSQQICSGALNAKMQLLVCFYPIVADVLTR